MEKLSDNSLKEDELDRDRNFGRRGLHPAVCDECGRKCFTPLSYTKGRPVLCKKCSQVRNRTLFK